MSSTNRVFIVLLAISILFGTLHAHPGGHESDDEASLNLPPILNDVRGFFLKHTNGTRLNRMSVGEFFDSYVQAHLGQLRSLSNDNNNYSYSCYASRLDDLSARLEKLNETSRRNSYLDRNRLAKVSTFLVANFDRCYASSQTSGDRSSLPASLTTSANQLNRHQTTIFEKILHNIGHLNKEG